jgi:hypothetical protein
VEMSLHGRPADWFSGATPSGPLESVETASSWVVHPYKAGVALVGDAAAELIRRAGEVNR